tara:strand:- start:1291 stop:1962 length:672 start_codon:yes stop_codon:yes gene_type:complete
MKDFTPSDDEKENNRIFDRIMGDGDSDKAWKNYEEARRMDRDGPISDEEWDDMWSRPQQKREAAKERWHDRGDVNSDPYSPHDPKEKKWTPNRHPSPFDDPKEDRSRPPYEYPYPPEVQDESPRERTPFKPRTEPSPYDEPPKESRMPGPDYPPKDDDTDPSLNKALFDTAFDLIKFGDCPVCLGDPAECPSPNEPMSECGTRRNAIKHMVRGKGGRPPITPR